MQRVSFSIRELGESRSFSSLVNGHHATIAHEVGAGQYLRHLISAITLKYPSTFPESHMRHSELCISIDARRTEAEMPQA
jgi:hypothetical protein